jgi:hypothetical protein
MTWPGGCYVWRTRKPGAVWGLPIIGRHFAYVGQTGSFAHRERQHTGKYLATDTFRVGHRPWSDLHPRCYRIPLPFKWMRVALEPLLVAILCPVYNKQLQPPYNFRKISPRTAAWQRRMRDRESTGWWLPRAVASVRLYHIIGYGAIAAGLYLGMWK